jgi:hypothetical protein
LAADTRSVVTMETAAPEFVVVDRPGASSGCACGGATDPELPRVAGDLEWLRWQGATVRRIDPRYQHDELEATLAARTALDELGLGALPVMLVDGVVVHVGGYPSRDALQGLLEAAAAGRY